MTDWVCGVCNNEPCTCKNISEAGLWANIWAKRRAGKKMRKKGEKGAPTPDAIKKAKEDIGTTTGSVVGAGDNPSGTVVIDKRRRKDKSPRVLKRFRKYLDHD